MRSFISRACRARLAPLATLFAAFTLAACADEQPVTAPASVPNARATGVSDLAPAADADSTRITFTIDDRAFVREGYALINGTVACSRAMGDQFYLVVRVEQKQPARVVGDGYGTELLVTCSTTNPQIWGRYVPALTGYFDAGKATVTVSVAADAPAWVASTPLVQNRRLLP